MIRQARKIAGIGLHVMIRPRGGDFLFDDDEFAIMEADIETAKAEGADGVVIGLLTADGTIDVGADARADRAGAAAVGDVSPGLRHDARSVRGAGDADWARRRPRAHLRPGGERARRPAADRRARPTAPASASSSCRAAASPQRNVDAHRRRREPAGNSFRRPGAGGRRHAVSPRACVHGRRIAPAGI